MGAQIRITKTANRRNQRNQRRGTKKPTPADVITCNPCSKIFRDPAIYRAHCLTKRHINKVWSLDAPECKVCPYKPTAQDDWTRHINGRGHQYKINPQK